MNNLLLYPFEIKPLTKEEAGGYLISFPDFNECISDGETPEEAMKNGLDALQETINALKSTGFPIPKPFSGRKNNDNFFQKIPENLYQRLETLSQKEKISINSLSK
ncbi:type II toxin-antitoxin system HicB family antitoxin [Cyanobacterium aponinum AL20118]|uniref:Type II toxin-antitoxin system HicB family antitoxin n=1 Tax=Cyanobacterium aponinum AL20115 TaxID=3090662 RepID=A0AAF0ZBB4_9CHRO|nr:type II toxin-antitoxin system HicB family antitoxin [Cyanobacterium aponinum]WPF89866.1 type II toxin-antitoxin system HicB family antitoxin [Cyanobacterium aponinum AL20115]